MVLELASAPRLGGCNIRKHSLRAGERASQSLASMTRIKISVIELRNLNYFSSRLSINMVVKTNYLNERELSATSGGGERMKFPVNEANQGRYFHRHTHPFLSSSDALLTSWTVTSLSKSIL